MPERPPMQANRLAAYALTVAFALLTGMFAWWTLHVFDEAESDARANLEDATALQAVRVERSLAIVDAVLLDVVDLVDEVGLEGLRSDAAGRRLRGLGRHLPVSGAVFVYDRRGDMLASSVPFSATAATNVADRGYFRHLLAGGDEPYIGEALRGRAVHKLFFPLARALRGRDGGVVGVVQIGVEVDYIAGAFPSLRQFQAKALGLYRTADGGLVARRPMDESWLGARVDDRPWFAFVGRGQPAWSGEVDGPDGPGLLSARRVSGLPLIVSGALTRDVIFERPLRQFRLHLALYVAATGMLGALAWLWRRSLRRESRSAEQERRALEDLNLAQAVGGIGSWRVDLRRKRFTGSEESCRIVGAPARATMSYPFLLGRVHPDDRARVKAQWRAAFTGAPFDLEYRILVDGRVKWVRAKGTLEFDESRVPRAGFGIVQDISERRQSETELRLRAAILEAMGQAAIATDLQGRILYWNRAAERLYGWGRDEVLGRSAFEVTFPPASRDEAVAIFTDLTRAAHWRGEFQVQDRGGRVFQAEVLSAPVLDENGQLAAIIGVSADLTDRQRVERVLRESEALSRSTLQALPAHIAVVDHAGRILAVNLAWSDFAAANHAGDSADVGPGADYLAVCRRAAQTGDAFAVEALAGLEAVLRGEQDRFSLHYPCDSPTEQRWFLLTVVPFDTSGDRGLVISHLDISDRIRTENSLRDSEERMRLALEVSHSFTFEWDRASDVVLRNPGCGPILGVAPDLAVRSTGEDHFRAIHPADLPHFVATVHALRPYSDRYRTEYRVIRADGAEVVLEEVARGSFDASGRLSRLVGIATDITARRRAEAALRETEAIVRAVLDSSPDPIFLKDRSGRLMLANPATFAVIGKPPEICIGKTDTEFYDDPRTASAIVENDQRIMATGRMEAVEERVFRSEDTRIFLSKKAPFRDAEGRTIGLIGIARDITDLKRAEAALVESDRRKSEFLAILAHELRNPLTPIANALELLKLRCAGDPVQQSAHAMIDRQLAHMVRLVDDLLDVGRITAGKLTLRRQLLELGPLIEQVAAALRSQLDQAGLQLNLVLPARPLIVDADPVRLAQVASNLLANACKYTGAGGQITLSAGPEGEDVVLRVTDTGVGIAPEDLPNLFDMFYQAAATPGRIQAGLGLGLWLSRMLVELHGGRIESRSDGPGLGSEFIVRLPAPEAAAPAARPSPGPAPEPATPGRHILLADDNADITASLAQLLRLHGHRVETAADGLRAVQMAAQCRPEVALLDIGMPRLDGYEACRRIRQLPGGADMLIIALTGWGQEGDRCRAEAAGFDGHLLKPIRLADLQRALEAKAGPPH